MLIRQPTGKWRVREEARDDVASIEEDCLHGDVVCSRAQCWQPGLWIRRAEIHTHGAHRYVRVRATKCRHSLGKQRVGHGSNDKRQTVASKRVAQRQPNTRRAASNQRPGCAVLDAK